jgi:hypothetical protein
MMKLNKIWSFRSLVLELWSLVVFVGSVLGGVNSAVFYPKPDYYNQGWLVWIFWQIMCALVIMTPVCFVYAVLLIILVCFFKSRVLKYSKVILHILTAAGILLILVFAGKPFIGDLRSFNHIMISLYIVIAIFCNVLGVEYVWRKDACSTNITN